MDATESWYIRKDDLRGTGRLWDDARMVIILQQKPNGRMDGDPFDFAMQVAKNNKGKSGFDFGVVRRDCLAWAEVKEPEKTDNELF